MTKLIIPGAQKPLNFAEYKTQLKILKDEQLELVKALTVTTDCLAEANLIIDAMKNELMKYISTAELDALLDDDDAA